jgi:hypothetical protein
MNGENIQLAPDGKTIIINDMYIYDLELYKFLKEIEQKDRKEMLIALLRTGHAGIKRMNNGSDIDFIEKRFDTMAQRFEEMFDPEKSSSFFNRLVTLLKKYFDEGGSIEHLLKNGPITVLKKELQDEIKKLREELIKKEIAEEYEEKLPAKGFKFEDEVEIILSNLVSQNIGDQLERTTNKTGIITNCLCGDFVLKYANNQHNIVLETKDCQNLSFNQIKETLEKAMTNRNGKYAIMIVRYVESLPKFIGYFNEFHNNMLIVALGSKETGESFKQIINLAIQWARLRLRKEISIDEESIEDVEDGIAQIKEKLAKFGLIKTQCSNIKKSTSEIYEIASDLRGDINELIERIQNAIISISDGGDTNVRS